MQKFAKGLQLVKENTYNEVLHQEIFSEEF